MYPDKSDGPRPSATRYLDVLRRHKVLVLLPIVLALAVSVPLAVKKPHKFVGSTTVWFDTAVPNPSSLDPGQPYSGSSPAQSGQAVFQELIATRQFLVAVGREGPLAARLATQGVPATSIDDKIVATLQSAFGLVPVGPQVLKLTMTGPDPSIIGGTLDSLVAQYSAQVASAHESRGKSQALYFQSQLSPKHAALNQAIRQLQDYQAANPTAPFTDPTLQRYVNLANTAQADVTNAESSYAQALLGLKHVGIDATFHVIDKPLAPVAQGRMKKILFTGAAGLLGGLLVSVLVLAALAAADHTARRPEDIEDSLGLEVVGSISEFPHSEPDRPRAHRARSS